MARHTWPSDAQADLVRCAASDCGATCTPTLTTTPVVSNNDESGDIEVLTSIRLPEGWAATQEPPPVVNGLGTQPMTVTRHHCPEHAPGRGSSSGHPLSRVR